MITNDVMRQNGLPSSPALLFVSTFAAAAVVAAIAYVSFGGRALIARGASERVLVSAVGNASGGGDTITGSGSGDSSKGGGKSSGGTAPHEEHSISSGDSPCSGWHHLHSAPWSSTSTSDSPH